MCNAPGAGGRRLPGGVKLVRYVRRRMNRRAVGSVGGGREGALTVTIEAMFKQRLSPTERPSANQLLRTAGHAFTECGLSSCIGVICASQAATASPTYMIGVPEGARFRTFNLKFEEIGRKNCVFRK